MRKGLELMKISIIASQRDAKVGRRVLVHACNFFTWVEVYQFLHYSCPAWIWSLD